ncbi:hypothetical protein FSHL1_004407 [Fusarium sambucinum]
MSNERMYMDAPGRQQFRQVWLWDAAYSKDTSATFDPQRHGPSHSTQERLPLGNELQPHHAAVRMLEVSLVTADDPKKYKFTGHSRDKGRQQKQKDRGTLSRDSNVFRAYIRMSEYIQVQAKTYIGCKFMDGRLCAIKISKDDIFYYREFWGDSAILAKPKNTRTNHISQAIKFYAADIKEEEPKQKTTVVPTQTAKKTTASGAVITHLEDIETKCQLLYDFYRATEDPQYLRAIKTAMVSALPGASYSPYTKDDGEAAFLAFDPETPLQDEDIANLIEEMKPNFAQPIDWKPEIIRVIHQVMSTEKLGDDHTLGALFPQSALAFFLKFCHNTIEVPIETETLVASVRLAFIASKDHAELSTRQPSCSGTAYWTLSDIGKDEGAIEPVQLGYTFVAHLRDLINAVQNSSTKFVEAVEKEHGGLLKQTSHDITRQFSTVSDSQEGEFLINSMAALNLATHAASGFTVVNQLGCIKEQLEDALVILSRKKE